MKKLFTFLIVIVAAGGAAYYYYAYGKKVEPPQVTQVAISQGDIVEIVQATGTLEPERRVDVGSQVSGTVAEMFVDFNSIVHKGDVMAKIDPTLLQVQVDIQKANIARQEGDITNQEVQLEDSQRNLKRTQQLAEAGLANQQQLEAAVLAVKSRQAQIDAAKKTLYTSQQQLAQAELNVSYTTIKSPIDGVVVERKVDRGQTVQASMSTPSFFVLATDLSTLKLTAGVDEAEIGKVRPGQTVKFLVDSYGRQEFEGTVTNVRLNATTSNNVVTYPVWIEVPNADYKLKPSMTANLRIIITTAQNAVRVPNTALRFRPNNDIYLALGLEPPKAGSRQINGGRNGGDVQPPNSAAAQPGGAPATGTAPQVAGGPQGGGDRAGRAPGGQAGQTGQSGQNRGNRPGGRGFGSQGGSMSNLTQEQRERMIEQMRASGGRGGGGGRTGANGAGRNATRVGNDQPTAQRPPNFATAQKIDELFQPIPKRIEPGSVWTWDEAGKKLTEHRVFLGVTDGQFSELVNGEIKVGQPVVTNVIIPQAARANSGQNSRFGGNQGRGNPGGMTPGNFGGGPGGGGGNNRGGGGGGGRGGGN